MTIRLLALTVKLKQKLISSEENANRTRYDTQLKENKRNEN